MSYMYIIGILYQYNDRSFSFHYRRSNLLLQNVLYAFNPGGSLYYFLHRIHLYYVRI